MPSLEDAARDYGGILLDDENLVVVQILLYGFDLKAPSPRDAAEWAEHFGLQDHDNFVVLCGDPRLISPETYGMIPGLQLIDKDFVLRYDAAGRKAPDDMWTDLWPAVGGLLQE